MTIHGRHWRRRRVRNSRKEGQVGGQIERAQRHVLAREVALVATPAPSVDRLATGDELQALVEHFEAKRGSGAHRRPARTT